MNLTIAAGVTIGCLAIPYLHAQSNSAGALLVLAKSDRTLSKVDPDTLRVLATAPSGPDPHEVTVSSDGRVAYISN
jgi:DNA-binding beta-propeller fold protein YncE